MSAANLQEILDRSGNMVDLLRNSQVGACIYPVVPAEFTSWPRTAYHSGWRTAQVTAS